MMIQGARFIRSRRSIWQRACYTLCLVSWVMGCASRGPTVPQPFPRVETPPPPVADFSASLPASSVPGGRVVDTALSYQGIRYRAGGASPSGFDCSGFVQYVYGQIGLPLPRNVAGLYRSGQPIDESRPLEAGDLVFFSTVAPGASHVGIATGDGNFVHAPSSGGQVRVEHLGASYWWDRYVGARRLTAGP